MKKIILYILILKALASCTTNRVDLLKADKITLQENIPAELDVSTSIYEDEGNIVILGKLMRDSLDFRIIPGHIDIKILSITGEEYANIKASFRRIGTWRRGPNHVAFRAELPGVPPQGSIVHITYHIGAH